MINTTKQTQLTLKRAGLGLIAMTIAPFLYSADKPANTTTQPHMQMQGQANDTQAQTPEVKLQQIRAEYQQINQQLQVIQRKAMQDPDVQEKEAAYQKALKAKMLEIAPDDMNKKVKKRFELTKKLGDAAAPDSNVNQEKLVSISQELRAVRQEVSSIEQEATAVPEVQTKQKALITLITDKMEEVNPDFSKLMKRQQELAQEFQAIRQQMGG